MTIRKATHADLDVLLAMARNFLALTAYGPLVGNVATFQLEYFIDDVLAHGVVLVADDGGQVLGLIALYPGLHPISRQAYADELAWWVEPVCRHASVGQQLLEAAERWARDCGLTMLKMVAPAESSIGAFYARMGYAPVETAYQKALVS